MAMAATRALTDKALAQNYPQQLRLLAMSNAILADRKTIIECWSTRKNRGRRGAVGCDRVAGMVLDTLEAAANQSIAIIERTLYKTRFWRQHQHSF